MNVFVLCTGRCGSTTFSRSCQHMTNYTSGHETRARKVGAARLAYPDRHIEVDNRLAWFLGRLDRQFGTSAFYVHLTRDSHEVAESFVRRFRFDRGIMKAYYSGVLKKRQQRLKEEEVYELCLDYINTTTANIDVFLRDKPLTMKIEMEEAAERLPAFWQAIGAEGDLDRAQAEWGRRHNASLAAASGGGSSGTALPPSPSF